MDRPITPAPATPDTAMTERLADPAYADAYSLWIDSLTRRLEGILQAADARRPAESKAV